MDNMALMQYVENAIIRGYDEKFIIDYLVKAGWNYFDVEAAIATVKMAPGFDKRIKAEKEKLGNEKLPKTELNFFQKIYFVLFKPSRFFTILKEDTELKKHLLYFSILVLFFSLVQLIVTLVSEGAFSSVLLSLPTIILILIILFASLFAYSFLVFLVAKLLGGESDYYGILKVILYSMTPQIILMPVSIFRYFGIPWSVVLATIGISETSAFSKVKGFFSLVLPFAGLIALAYIMAFIYRLLFLGYVFLLLR